MNSHDEIRGLLSLVAAGALDAAEEALVAQHLQTCAQCAAELGCWEHVAAGLRALPTPQPRANLVEIARARAGERLAMEAEMRWQRKMMFGALVLGWILIAITWPLLHWLAGELFVRVAGIHAGLLREFLLGAAILWLTGGIAGGILALQSRRERGLS
jgi:anti-sigma factor RsiW